MDNKIYIYIYIYIYDDDDDDAKKLPVSHTAFARSKQYLHNKKRRPNREHRCGAGQISSEGQVRTSHNSRVPKLWWIMRTLFFESLGFYSSVEPTFLSCVGRLFLMEKIIIDGRILRDSFHIRILFISGLYWLRSIVGCKLFPSRATWWLFKPCHVALRSIHPEIRPWWAPSIVRFVHLSSFHPRFVHYWTTGLASSGLFKQAHRLLFYPLQYI